MHTHGTGGDLFKLSDKQEWGVTTTRKNQRNSQSPTPTNTTQVKSFLGMLNYYHRHLPNLAHLLEPLHLLRKNTQWTWGTEQDKAFKNAKETLCSASLLVHFDPLKPITLSCDASPYGLGAVLSHLMEDGTERPIAFASRTLANAESNYSQIEKEGLAIIYAVSKFHQYLYGTTFTLVTDHKQKFHLVCIYNVYTYPKQGIYPIGVPPGFVSTPPQWRSIDFGDPIFNNIVILISSQYSEKYLAFTKNCHSKK